jgi:hypothetical protein
MLEATPHAIVHAAIGGDGGDLTTMVGNGNDYLTIHRIDMRLDFA